MATMKIDGAQFRDMIVAGAVLLEKNKAAVDALNVFPVPDGDTGTNMSMTMQAAVREVRETKPDATVGEVADALSMGALRGARGNSGVILSQIFRGFSKACKGETMMDAALLSKALTIGAESAYKAVMKPKEGTILTVSRVIAEKTAEKLSEITNVYRLMDYVIEAGEKALAETPEQLPVLKEAGVVDSGGKGLMTIYQGFKLSLEGEEVENYEALVEAEPVETPKTNDVFAGEITFGYCTEFFVIHPAGGAVSDADVESLRTHLNRIGDSVVVAADNDFIKAHVHTNAPGKVLQMALQLGELDRVKIENMREQNRQVLEERKKNEKEFGLVAVSAGEGLDEIFKTLAVDRLISGGQTMNPSINTIAEAINAVNARNVFILPNNSNIILAAQEAARLTEANVILLPTKTIPQGVAACMAYSTDATIEENEAAMREAFADVESGSVTFAVRETKFDGREIHEGDIIGLINNKMATVGKSVDEVCIDTIDKMIASKGAVDGVITLFYGEGRDEAAAEKLAEKIEEKHPDADVLVQYGGQPLYYYYISVQ